MIKQGERVQDHWPLDEDLMHTKADKSIYWKRCSDFYESVKGRHHWTLSDKQETWLDAIEKELTNG